MKRPFQSWRPLSVVKNHLMGHRVRVKVVSLPRDKRRFCHHRRNQVITVDLICKTPLVATFSIVLATLRLPLQTTILCQIIWLLYWIPYNILRVLSFVHFQHDHVHITWETLMAPFY